MNKMTPKDSIAARAFELIKTIGPEVGEYLYQRSLERLSGITHKDSMHDVGDIRSVIVTEADLKVHDAVVKEFQEDPVTIIAEEGIVEKKNASYRIVLDDLDGTYNAARGVVARSVISLAIDKHSRPLAGIWYNPYVDEMVIAQVGNGAWHLRAEAATKIKRVSATARLSQARIVTQSGIRIPNPRSKLWNPPLAIIVRECLDAFNLGSSVLGLMEVALGRMEGWVVPANKAWDLWGARAIFSELSIPYAFFSECWEKRLGEEEITDFDSKNHLFAFACAANEELFQEIIEILQQ